VASTPTRTRYASVPGEPNGSSTSPVVRHGRHRGFGNGYWLARADGAVSTHGDAVNYGSMAGSRPQRPDRPHRRPRRTEGGYWLVGQRRRDLQLRRRPVLRLDGWEETQRTGGGPGPDRRRQRLLAGRQRRRHLRLRGRRLPRGRWEVAHSTPPWSAWRPMAPPVATGWSPATAASSAIGAPFFGSTGGHQHSTSR
jgi:hypothetical protein